MGNEFNRDDDALYSSCFSEDSYCDELTEEEYCEISKEGEADENVEVIVICEECNNRWYDLIFSEEDEDEIYCPLCGSKRVILI